ncbi:MAG: molybdopterin-dependent oxidoreductase [Phycisphaerae bacterium]|nr:molybdopterin-dependent oxidoreductase [Phycisphaerae bacterium]NIP52122.1 molybdopterin-dependent oxidoreductase [Phycisphaerae bacterium]NIS51129.1 molybdopterin-dependent oxidoreductase [Phycisphaerae bacterium]NIU11762.1 molybdopterin-dependent oxidoreductase [Phycisphaerae bacterium]NIU59579.1 molybdopterin-dependent oxidoreductase [Phycisphaerae bacterium]
MTQKTLEKTVESQQPEPSIELRDEFKLSRRSFVKLLGAGLLITVSEGVSLGRRGGRSRQSISVAARLHINQDGTITVMTGKVEEGQGARAQLTQAAAEELRVTADRIRLVMADTALVPNDGRTAGSRTTPSTVPAVRRGATTARQLLTRLAAEQWKVNPDALEVRNGIIKNRRTKKTITYGDLAKSKNVTNAFKQSVSSDVTLTPVDEWEVLGTSYARPNWRDLVTGAHRFPSDIVRPNMLYGKILRPPSYGATLESIDLSNAEAMKDVVVFRDGQFVGCAAPTSFRANQALEAVAKTASWKTVSHPSSRNIFSHLKKNARSGGRSRPRTRGSVDKAFADAGKVLSETYEVAYVQHTPMEPRAAVAEWQDDKLTVWTGCDGPQSAQGDLARTFQIPSDRVRVIIPDMGSGFGGKHSAEAAIEAARLAKAAKRPVAVHWTRAEEFTWAYFRPAAVIECKGGLDNKGSLIAWDFTNINAGGAAIDTPYNIANTKILSLGSDSPLRQGAYRCLAATANNFARESFMDELAAAVGADPLAFRLAHLENPRIRTVLESAAKHFDWPTRRKKITRETGVGLACGTEKNSVVAACVEVTIDRKKGQIKVNEVCEAFECGPIQNPGNLLSQVQGCIIMGMGPALGEEIKFEDGKILNASFADYHVPRFKDVPKIDVHLVNKTDILSAGGGETPIIAIAPAIANAVFAATGVRLRSMPMRAEKLRA